MELSSNWNNERYVELYLVEKVLNLVVPLNSDSSNWIPRFDIKNPDKTNSYKADYLIKDRLRKIEFLVEVKTAKTRIDNAESRQQLRKYLHYSGVEFGVLIDPFLVEIYEFKKGQSKRKDRFIIEDVSDIGLIANFINRFFNCVKEDKMKTIAIHNAKGGVGKTTLAVNIAYELSKRGEKVLVVDLDDQANSSLTVGVNKAEEMNNASNTEELRKIYQHLDERLEVIDFIDLINKKEENIESYKKCIVSIDNPFGVDVLPASHKTTDDRLPNNPVVLKHLDKGIRKLANHYQYVIFDTAPGKSNLTWCGLYAAKYLIIPSQMEYLSVYGIKNVIQNARDVWEDSNKKRGNILGIVPMMVDGKKLNNIVQEYVGKQFSSIPVLTTIKRATGVGKASNANMPMAKFAEQDKDSRKLSSEIAESLEALTDQLIQKINQDSSLED